MKITEMIDLLTQAQASGVTEVEFFDAITREGLSEAWIHDGSTTTPLAIVFESEKNCLECCQNTYILEKGYNLIKRKTLT